jgi:dnd system-associated protein 4|tara:strand:+ start:5506 stop:6015 length:510 start_codon:yes stop_codon:yes gene_type:complete
MSKLNSELYNKQVRRNNKYKNVVDLLCFANINGKKAAEYKIFDNIKDLIVFAAMVGKKFEKTEEVESKNNTSIVLGTFSGSGSTKNSRVDQHNIIFMFGLLIHKDMKYLRDENIGECISLFEKYSNGGLSIIHDWLNQATWRVDILIEKISDHLPLDTVGLDLDENPFS